MADEGLFPMDDREKQRQRCRDWRKKNPEKQRESTKRWEAANKEHVRNMKKVYAASHSEEKAVYMKDWRKKNSELMKKQHEEWNKKNPGKKKTITKQWKANNKDKVHEYSQEYRSSHQAEHRSCQQQRRALKKGTETEKIIDCDIFQRDGWICQLCFKPVSRRLKHPHPRSASLDHIVPLSKGGAHTRTNVHLAHFRCNLNAYTGGVKQLLLIG